LSPSASPYRPAFPPLLPVSVLVRLFLSLSLLFTLPSPPARSTRAHTHARAHALSLRLSVSPPYYPYWGSLFLRVTTQWRCHTLAPSSNQCYCFIVPLLLLLLDTRKGDPSIPGRFGNAASLRLASPRADPKRERASERASESRGASS